LMACGDARAAPVGSSSTVFRQTDGDAADTTATEKQSGRRKRSRFYFGGNIGLSIYGSSTQISIQPLVGYKITPKASVGIKGDYQYLSDRRRSPTLTSHNYGGSLFSRYRFIPGGFAQAEFALISYDLVDRRATVPFLFLGGGYSRPLGNGVWLVVEVLMDVIQDPDSPYESWEPRVNVGINAGF